jgi:outer membrane lipoprotein SlyB
MQLSEQLIEELEGLSEAELDEVLDSLTEQELVELEEGIHHLVGRTIRDNTKAVLKYSARGLATGAGYVAGAALGAAASGGHPGATMAGGAAGGVAGGMLAQKIGEKIQKKRNGGLTNHQILRKYRDRAAASNKPKAKKGMKESFVEVAASGDAVAASEMFRGIVNEMVEQKIADYRANIFENLNK